MAWRTPRRDWKNSTENKAAITVTTAQNNRFLVSIQFPLTKESSIVSYRVDNEHSVLVVDDEPLARVGITTRLSAYSDMLVVGECGTGEEARAKIPQVSPDLIFVDVEMPGISGLDLLRELPREQARCIVFLTAHEEYAPASLRLLPAPRKALGSLDRRRATASALLHRRSPAACLD